MSHCKGRTWIDNVLERSPEKIWKGMEKITYLYISGRPNIVKVTGPIMMRWSGQSTRIGDDEKCTHNISR
jgi:hypothetical protein